jgi:serine protease AprX
MGARVPNGYCDERHTDARVGGRFAKASGTSQAAAVVSGEVALLLQALPKLTPDQVKGLLQSTAHPFSSTDAKYRGDGLTDVKAAATKKSINAAQPMPYGLGTGSIELSRGTSHVNDGVSDLTGEVDIFGHAWNGAAWAKASAAGTAWNGGSWMGSPWSGSSWNGTVWGDLDWTSTSWSGRTWRDDQWQGRTWRNGSWTGGGWTGRTWRDADWTGRTWRAEDFASVNWMSRTWG